MLSGKIKLYNRWGFLECDHSIGQYYRSLFCLTFNVKLQRPSNKEHITIICPEDNIVLTDLHNYNNTVCSFLPQTQVYWNGSAVWLDVLSNDIESFRISIGLQPQPFIPLHLCIGYLP